MNNTRRFALLGRHSYVTVVLPCVAQDQNNGQGTPDLSGTGNPGRIAVWKSRASLALMAPIMQSRRELQSPACGVPGPDRSRNSRIIPELSQNPLHHSPRNPRQPRVQPLELHRQPFVIDAQQIQHGCMKVGYGDGIIDRRVA